MWISPGENGKIEERIRCTPRLWGKKKKLMVKNISRMNYKNLWFVHCNTILCYVCFEACKSSQTYISAFSDIQYFTAAWYFIHSCWVSQILIVYKVMYLWLVWSNCVILIKIIIIFSVFFNTGYYKNTYKHRTKLHLFHYQKLTTCYHLPTANVN